MPYTNTLNNDSPQALAFVEFAKNFDEYGIPIKYRDEIMALSKKVNKAVAKRWDEALAKRDKEVTI